MPSQVDFLASMGLGVAPALGLLWFSLRRFDRPHVEFTLFDDRRVFGSLAVGMIFGVLASLLSLALPRSDIVSSVAVVGGVFLVEELFKVVYLYRKGYRGRFDTTFYGVALGAGAASTAAAATIYWSAEQILAAPELLATFAVFSLSLCLVNVDTGALIGFGAARGALWRSLGRAVGVRVVHAGFLFPFLLGTPNPWSAVSALTSTGFALIVFLYVYGELLPNSLPEDFRRRARRERRRARTARE